MKKIFNKILVAVSFLAVAVGCSVKEIEFSHEADSFTVKDNLILIEAIAPLGISNSDEVFIVGPALGDSATVVSDTKYRLEQSMKVSRKWAVYLDPKDFKDGKTLADGFCFVVLDKGHERTPLNKDPEHSIEAKVGESYLVYMAGGWSNDFIVRDPIDIPEHDNFRVYVNNQSGNEEIRLYMWGDKNDLYGAWPGIAPAGEVELGGVLWTYFKVGMEASLLEEHLIVNNNNNGWQVDVDKTINFDVADYFVNVTADGAVLLPNLGIDKKPNLVEDEEEPEVVVYDNPGYKIYVLDNSGWGGNLYLHVWNNKGYATEWPGLPVSETIEQGGKTYKVFALTGDISDTEIGFIVHSDYKDTWNRVTKEKIVLEHSLAYEVKAGPGIDEIALPVEDLARIFVEDKRNWPGDIFLHIWDDNGFSTVWPGIPAKMATRKGVNYLYFDAPQEVNGKTVHAIIHSNVDDATNRVYVESISLDKDRYYTLDNGTASFDQALEYNPSTIYVIDRMGWGSNLHLYSWGNDEQIFGDWPGTAGKAMEGTFCGAPVYTFDLKAADAHKEAHLIFNDGDGGDGHQFDGEVIETGEDHVYVINSDFTWANGTLAARLYVKDGSGWEYLYAYVWGTTEIFGGWPGAQFTSTQEINGVTYRYVEIPANCLGNVANIILHNNKDNKGDAGTDRRFEGGILSGLTVEHDFYFAITADSISVPE